MADSEFAFELGGEEEKGEVSPPLINYGQRGKEGKRKDMCHKSPLLPLFQERNRNEWNEQPWWCMVVGWADFRRGHQIVKPDCRASSSSSPRDVMTRHFLPLPTPIVAAPSPIAAAAHFLGIGAIIVTQHGDR